MSQFPSVSLLQWRESSQSPFDYFERAPRQCWQGPKQQQAWSARPSDKPRLAEILPSARAPVQPNSSIFAIRSGLNVTLFSLKLRPHAPSAVTCNLSTINLLDHTTEIEDRQIECDQ